eukprot:2963224-Amphidinium_carterae.2
MWPTGSDVGWAKQVGLRSGDGHNGYEKTPDPRGGHYVCPVCNARSHLTEVLADHMCASHDLGLEPNYCNEYSVAELVSGINNLAVGKKFRADDGETKPKFLMTLPEAKIPWMGHPIFEMDNEPMSLKVILDEDGQVINSYRDQPQGQLSTEHPALDLRRRLQPGDEAEPEVEPPTAKRPLIPAAMTSQLWWTKMVDPVTRRERELGEVPEEESFNNMSPWRNLVRAWEMRNHERLIERTWHE